MLRHLIQYLRASQCALFVILAFLSLVGCKPKAPSYVLSESKMESVLYDFHLAQAIAETGSEDVERDRYLNVQSVFEKHGITEAQFDTSMIYYNTHPKKMNAIYERLVTRYEAEAKSLGVGLTDSQIYASYSQYGDTANVWSGASIMFMRNDGIENIKTLKMECDTTFRAGDSYKLTFMSNFLSAGQNLAFTFLTIHYEDGTKISQFRRLSGNYEMSLSIEPADTFATKRPKNITITFFHQPDNNGRTGYFFITSPSLLRMHKKVEAASKEDNAEETDSLELLSDSLSVIRAERPDTTMRMSPEEFRNSKPVEHRINVVKEKPIIRRPETQNRGNQRLR